MAAYVIAGFDMIIPFVGFILGVVNPAREKFKPCEKKQHTYKDFVGRCTCAALLECYLFRVVVRTLT